MIDNSEYWGIESTRQDKTLRGPHISNPISESRSPQSLVNFIPRVMESIGQLSLDMTYHNDENSQLKAMVFNFEYFCS